MDGNALLLAAVPVVGFAAGFVNTLAGSDSLLTLPLLILLGLPANVANGTNRVGVLVQNVVAVGTFRRRGALDVGSSWRLVTAVGAVLRTRYENRRLAASVPRSRPGSQTAVSRPSPS